MEKEENILYRPVNYILPDTTYGEFILNEIRGAEEKIVQIDAASEKAVTNCDILEQSILLAKVLEEKGVESGDTIAISSENLSNWFVPVIATLFKGACIAPMNPAYLEGEIRHCLNIIKPKIIFVSQRTELLINKIIKTLNWNIELIQLEDKTAVNQIDILSNLLNKTRKEYQVVNPTFLNNYKATKVNNPGKKCSVVLFSSGTTGLPKGVMLSHRNLFTITLSLLSPQFSTFYNRTKYLLVLPFYHGYGFAMMLITILSRATAVVMKSFQPELFCETIEKHKINVLPLVPTIMVFLAKNPIVSNYNFSSLREIICGAASLPLEVKNDVQKRLGDGVVIRTGYGMTELSIASSISPYGVGDANAIGHLSPGTACKIVQSDLDVTTTPTKSLEAYQIGELCFKGDHVMIGYKGDQKATDQTIDRHGWLHTGDIGYYDHNGCLFVTGRIKELIKYNSFQIAPVEIENILMSHPDVADAAVVGKDDPLTGQIPLAFVVLKPTSTITSKQLCDFVDGQVSVQKKLRGGVHFIKAIPKNPSGKILRKELQLLVSKL